MDYERLNFEYFETYSFQRKGDFEIYEHLFSKYAQDETSLTEDEKTVFYKWRKSNLYSKENNSIFTNNGELNKSAELVYKSDKLSNVNDKLIEILKTPFVDYDAWMCAPIYRDAILFYDTNDDLIDGINICFQCSNVVNLKREEILTDRVVYQKLKELLILIGHRIN